MFVINGTSYNCPLAVARIFEEARLAYSVGRGYRLRIYYGDPATGLWWGDTQSGYIGRSAGPTKVPLVLWNKLSRGGPPVLDHCIVKVEHANKRQGGVLFDIIKEHTEEKEYPIRRLH